MFRPDDGGTTLTSTELERALTFYALQGGIERNDGDLLHALHAIELALPSVAVVHRLVELTAAGEIEALAGLESSTPTNQLGSSSNAATNNNGKQQATSFYRKRSVELAGIRDAASTGSGNVIEDQMLMSLHLTNPPPVNAGGQFAFSDDDDDDDDSGPFSKQKPSTTTTSSGNKAQSSHVHSVAVAVSSRFVSQREWVALLTVLKRCFHFAVEHAGVLSEEKNSFAAIAMAAAAVKREKSDEDRFHRTGSASSVSSSSQHSNTSGGNEMIIAAEKLQTVFSNFGLTFDIDAFMRALDENGDGNVDFNEFLALVSSTDDALESYLPAFVACGGREICVTDRGFIKPPNESSVADDTALLLTVKELQKHFPYLPAHVISQVPANHYHSHHRRAISGSSSISNKPHQQQQHQRRQSMATTFQRTLIRSFLMPPGGGEISSTASPAGVGRSPFSKTGSSPLTKTSGGNGQQHNNSNQVPFDCDPSFVTLQRFAKMMHLWGKRPRDLNLALQEQMRVLSKQRALVQHKQQQQRRAVLSKAGVGGSSSSLHTTTASSPTGDGVIGENAMALLVRACREIDDSGANLHATDFDHIGSIDNPLASERSFRSNNSSHNNNNNPESSVMSASSRRALQPAPNSTGEAPVHVVGAASTSVAAAAAGASVLDVFSSMKENQRRSTTGNSPGDLHIEHTAAIGSRAIAGAAENTLFKHYQRISQHRSDVNEAQFRDITPPKRFPRFSPTRKDEDRVPLHEPKRLTPSVLGGGQHQYQPRTPPRNRRGSASFLGATPRSGITSPDAANPHATQLQSTSATSPVVTTAPRVVMYARTAAATNAPSNSTHAEHDEDESVRSPMPPAYAKPETSSYHHSNNSNHAATSARSRHPHVTTTGGSTVKSSRGGSSSIARSDTFSSAAAALFPAESSPPRNMSPQQQRQSRSQLSSSTRLSGNKSQQLQQQQQQHKGKDVATLEREAEWWNAMRGKLLDKKQLRNETTSHLAHMHQWARSVNSSGGLTHNGGSTSSSSMGANPMQPANTAAAAPAASSAAPLPQRVPTSSSGGGGGGERATSSSCYVRGPHPAAPTLHVPTRPNTAGRHGRPTSSTGRNPLNSTTTPAQGPPQGERKSTSPVLLTSSSPPLIANNSLQAELRNAAKALKGKASASSSLASASKSYSSASPQSRQIARSGQPSSKQRPAAAVARGQHHFNLQLQQPVLPSPSAASTSSRGRRLIPHPDQPEQQSPFNGEGPTTALQVKSPRSIAAQKQREALDISDGDDDADVEFLCASGISHHQQQSPRAVTDAAAAAASASAAPAADNARLVELASSLSADAKRRLAVIGAHCALRRIQKWWRLRKELKQLVRAACDIQKACRGHTGRHAVRKLSILRAKAQEEVVARAAQALKQRQQKGVMIIFRVARGYAARCQLYGRRCEASRLEEESLFDGVFLDDDFPTTSSAAKANKNEGFLRGVDAPLAPPPRVLVDHVDDEAQEDAGDETSSTAGTAMSKDAAELFGTYFPMELLRSAGLPAPPPPRTPNSSLPPKETVGVGVENEVESTSGSPLNETQNSGVAIPASLGSPRSLDVTSGMQSPTGGGGGSDDRRNAGAALGSSSRDDVGGDDGARRHSTNSDLGGIVDTAVTASWESDAPPPPREQGSPTRASFEYSSTRPARWQEGITHNSDVHSNSSGKRAKLDQPNFTLVGGGAQDGDNVPLEPISSLKRVASAAPSTNEDDGDDEQAPATAAATHILGVPLLENPFGVEENSHALLPVSRRVSKVGDISQLLLFSHNTSTSSNGWRPSSVAASFGKSVETIFASVSNSSHRRPSASVATALGSSHVLGTTAATALSTNLGVSVRRPSSELPSSLLADSSEEDRLILLESPINDSLVANVTTITGHRKFDGFAAPMMVYRVMRGYHIRKKLFQRYSRKVYEKPLLLLQRLGRGFQRRRRLGDQRWAIEDAKSTIANWMHRDTAATTIQCAFRQALAKQKVRMTKQRVLNRIHIRTSAEGVTIVLYRTCNNSPKKQDRPR
ncbi:Hypothetical protein, putative [Bodo saltans]|uniref:EF-hand domain-containing protein n=1 Tax=Bodo saltans TaxID=75058 RepID=A0A0S4IXK1_BODSA|nr:Hypothetical protein, putative [Bodo saltans]|eukprot:CUG06621.1 Hypothetical protein, putative [Bodo saltans]